jgi:hypothetical protein
MPKPSPYVGQIVIERGFTRREDAERWMSAVETQFSAEDGTGCSHVETHLWEDAFPTAREVAK